MSRRSVLMCIVVAAVLLMATALALQNQQLNRQIAVVLAGEEPDARPSRHDVSIRVPDEPDGIVTGRLDVHGNAIRLSCRSCHEIRPANSRLSAAGELKEFHQGLSYRHGTLTCVACHNTQDGYTTLHLADGSTVAYADTMKLCAQCHGPQHRDYQHGSHGGMTGYWDLSRGPRQRNHCIDCHDPHSPAFPMMYPADGPNDRFSPSHKDAIH